MTMESNSATSWYGRLLNVLVPTLLTLVGVVLVLEVGLRHFYQLIPLPVCASDFILGTYYCQPYFVYDKPIRLAYTYEPNLRLEGMWDPANPYLTDVGAETRPVERSDAFPYLFETDEMGFPNSQDEWQSHYDIVVTGDSFVTRSAPQTWIELLAAQTGRSILTLGASSWATINEAAAVTDYGLDKSPDWVVLLYFEGNDLLNVQQYQEKQPSGLSWKEYDLQGVPFYRRLMTYHLLHYLWTKPEVADTAAVTYRYPVMVNTEVGPTPTVLKDIHLLPLSASYETVAASDEFLAIQAALLALQAQVEATGARFLLVFVPAKEHVYWSRIWDAVDVNNILARTVTVSLSGGGNGRLQWTPQYLSYEAFSANINAQERLLSDLAAAHEMEFLNLTPIFWQQTIQHGEFYHYADPHCNQAGNQLVADEIQAYIEAAERGPGK